MVKTQKNKVSRNLTGLNMVSYSILFFSQLFIYFTYVGVPSS